jgi:hypothetical protein
MNGATAASVTQSPNTGFVAVNTRPTVDANGGGVNPPEGHHSSSHHSHHHHAHRSGASTATRNELLSKFFTLSDRRAQASPSNGDVRRSSLPPTNSIPKPQQSAPQRPGYNSHETADYASMTTHAGTTSPVPIPHTPASLLPPHPQPSQRAAPEKDDGGPYKAEMVSRMEILAKGERVMPPCDRCRRLHMDCLKNLTACMGCTKKHAKCSWKEVKESELRMPWPPAGGAGVGTGNGSGSSGNPSPSYAPGGTMAMGGVASTAPMGTAYDDMSDEPASVGQRTPPPRMHTVPMGQSSYAAHPQTHQQQAQTAHSSAVSTPHDARDMPIASPAQQNHSQYGAPTAPSANNSGLPASARSDGDIEEQLQRAAKMAEEEQIRQQHIRERERDEDLARTREYMERREREREREREQAAA